MPFGRKKNKGEDPEVETTAEETAPEAAPLAATTGPYDEADVDDERPRLDLGGIKVPVPEGVELRVDVSPEGQVQSAVAVHGQSQMQINAFAAPRREGIWDEVRTEILQSLRNEQDGQAEEVEGTFGRELRARIPAGPGQFVPARFIGADGPRWFLRALITGPAALEPSQAGLLEEVFRGTVVIRGNEAMAPRDVLPLRLPKEAQDAAAAAAAEQAGQEGDEGGRFEGGDDFNPFERGPEITETR
ncbi:MAG TPA: DUF3710 domain-containing protein [Frankiaceae bacterium]|nr:DUF3710 domain-containing protein [Frankiaceae bacterium]